MIATLREGPRIEKKSSDWFQPDDFFIVPIHFNFGAYLVI